MSYHDERSDQHYALTNPGGNATSQTFPTQPTSVLPPNQGPAGQGVVATGDGVIQLGAPSGAYAPKRLRLVPIGRGNAGARFQMKVYGWHSTGGGFFGNPQTATPRLWVPTPLAAFTCTLGPVTGQKDSDLGPSFNFCNAVVQSLGPTVPAGALAEDWFAISPGGSDVAQIVMRVLGARFVEVLFQQIDPVEMNCLYLKV